MSKQPAAFGTWPSPLSAEQVAGSSRRFAGIQGAGPWIYWAEGRPNEQGRQVIMRARPGMTAQELLPAPYSARSHIHEYGGGEFLVDDGIIYFTNDADQDIYVLVPGGQPERLTNEPQIRLANYIRDPQRRRLIAVGEQAPADGETAPQNMLVSIALTGSSRGRVTTLTSGHDFYASPCLSPDGSQLASLAWDLPDMPWDQAGLYLSELNGAGEPEEPHLIAGNDGSAAFQPEWADNNSLIFVSDRSGWGNPYIWNGETTRCLLETPAEFISPLWQLGIRSYALTSPHSLVASYFDRGQFHLADIDITTGQLNRRETTLAHLDAPTNYDDGIAGIAGREDAPQAIVAIPANEQTAAPVILRSAADIELRPGNISRAQVLRFPGGDGQDSYGLYYPPASTDYCGLPGTLPPAIITVHGGPTAAATRGLKLRTQFFTSRGFAVLDVDYAGSAFYGRAYRDRLDGKWGLADVADCVAAADYLAKAGLADPSRIAIQGGSAGGYTVLMALGTSDIFAAGSCHYGISDLTLLLKHTHKFESGYLHRLMGTTADNYEKLFRQRSPLTLIDNFKSPVILFQGLEDKVVPPQQSQLMVDKLRTKGLTVAYHEFAGEGHGFRRADTIAEVLNEELAFFTKTFQLDGQT